MQQATCPFFNAKLLLLESGAFISEQCFTVLVSLRALWKHNREIPGAFSRLCFEESVLKRMLFPSKKTSYDSGEDCHGRPLMFIRNISLPLSKADSQDILGFYIWVKLEDV